MEIEVNINKFYVMIAIGIVFILAGSLVYAYGTSSPSTFGHSSGEVNLGGNFQTTYKASSQKTMSASICCDSGWVRTGCGESGATVIYSYPTTGECCRAIIGPGQDGAVYALCAKLD